MMETVYVQYSGHRPFIEAIVYDSDGLIKWRGVDTSIGNLIRDIKMLFRGYNIQAKLPGVKNEIA